MSNLISVALLGLATSLVVGCAGSGATVPPATTTNAAAPQPANGQPYAGLDERPIRALAPERVDDLLAGRGAGYALAAELNHYPGPLHVLQLATELQLRPDQEQATRDSFAAMQREAQALGRQLVDREAELDRAFRGGISGPDLARLTDEIAVVEGRLRHAHLAAHLRMKDLLDPAQIARYDHLRGYATASEAGPTQDGAPGPGQQHPGQAKHGQR